MLVSQPAFNFGHSAVFKTAPLKLADPLTPLSYSPTRLFSYSSLVRTGHYWSTTSIKKVLKNVKKCADLLKKRQKVRRIVKKFYPAPILKQPPTRPKRLSLQGPLPFEPYH
jgi:hypothetical protein